MALSTEEMGYSFSKIFYNSLMRNTISKPSGREWQPTPVFCPGEFHG